jgi:hypothetical protein
MHQQIYPRLAVECVKNSDGWDQAKERAEGKRMRRLIREIKTESTTVFAMKPSRRALETEPTTNVIPKSSTSVEIFKSFRVSMEDRTYRVLPAALKKYNINAPWEQYALYIIYGDNERCLGMDEKPLVLFKHLDKAGKKPMLMLRKIALVSQASAASSPTTSAVKPVDEPPAGIV